MRNKKSVCTYVKKGLFWHTSCNGVVDADTKVPLAEKCRYCGKTIRISMELVPIKRGRMSDMRGSDGKVVRFGGLYIQVCVPESWTDDQVIRLAETEYPCGTADGWKIRKKGARLLGGHDERVQCANEPGNVHVTLDA